MSTKTSAPLPPQADEGQQLHLQQHQSPYTPYGAVVAQQQPHHANVAAPAAMLTAAVPLVAHPVGSLDLGDEQRQRRSWKNRAFWCFLLSVAFIIMGASCIAMRDDGNTGGCCLPQGCDVTLLNNGNFTRPAVSQTGLCVFTQAEMKTMGCDWAFQRTLTCQLSWVPEKPNHNKHHDNDDHRSNPCTDRNPVKVGIVGTGVTLVVIGSLGVLYAALFLFNGLECYGNVQEKRTCGNRCAMISTSFVWMTCFGGAVCGIVFASMLTYSVYHPFDTQASCDVVDSSLPINQQQCKVGHGGKMWSGSECPAVGQPANVFTFASIDSRMKAHAFFGLGYSVFFVVGTIVVFGWLVKTWCCDRRGPKQQQQQQQQQHGTPVMMPVYGIVAHQQPAAKTVAVV